MALLVLLPIAGASQALKVANGRIKSVFLDKQEFVLSYRHPVSGQLEELKLRIDSQTGFSGGIRLPDLQQDDPVSVDYQEDEKGEARAVLVSRVNLTSVPIERKDIARLIH